MKYLYLIITIIGIIYLLVNLIGYNYANQNGGITFGITAFDGGKLKEIIKNGVHITTGKKEYGPAEDAHMVINHLIGAYLTKLVRER